LDYKALSEVSQRTFGSADKGDNEEDSQTSLTASDFEVLNSENFFDRINDSFQVLSSKIN
jgi:hypothetical protein